MKTRWMMAVAMAAALSCGYAQAQDRLARRQGDVMAPPPPAAASAVAGAPNCWAGGCDTAKFAQGCNSCDTGCASCDTTCKYLDSGCGKCRWIVDTEAAFLRYHRSAGVDAAPTGIGGNVPQDIEFDFSATPRVTVGWIAASGIGVRCRAWDYDETARATNGSGSYISTDAFTIDAEVFEEVRLTKHLWLEGSGGIRYVNFREDVFVDGLNLDTDGSTRYGTVGGILGLQLKRDTRVGTFFARGRCSVLMGDAVYYDTEISGSITTERNVAFDSVQGIIELAVGYELNWELSSGGIFSIRTGAEWQQWMNFDYNSPYVGGGPVPGDVGFGGFFAGAGLKF